VFVVGKGEVGPSTLLLLFKGFRDIVIVKALENQSNRSKDVIDANASSEIPILRQLLKNNRSSGANPNTARDALSEVRC
jgi:hypothetical protein